MERMRESGAVRNVVLVGYMGTGKTTVGQRVAKGLGFTFVDTDSLVAEQFGKGIPEIFTDHGEDAFRVRETEILKTVLVIPDQVISTGGGIILHNENRELILRSGFCIWLTASEDLIWKRVSGNSERPLLANSDPRGIIHRMLVEREPFYREVADMILDTSEMHPDEIAYGICESVRVHYCGQ